MTLAVERDLAAVAAGISRWLAARRGVDDLALTRCDRPSGGLSSETLMIEASGTRADGGGYSESLVVRLAPAAAGIFPEYDLAVQARAQDTAAAHGIPAAAPTELEADPHWIGAPFLVMPTIAGHIPGPMPLRDLWINASVEQARRVSRHLYDTLAAIHQVDWRAAGLDRSLPVRDIDAELAYWTRYLDWYADGEMAAPVLHEALGWCAAHRPSADPPAAFLWGDVRLGNIIFDDERNPVAVLDWEMTTVGAPEHDLAWYLTLEATQNELFGSTVPGFLDHDEACAYYEARVGRSLQALAWFEVFAMLRSSAIMTRLAVVGEREGKPAMLPIADNPLLDLLSRRITEAGTR
jgi:aminoglycoside phosphotransferase (APT) family kinase protein